MTSNPVTSNSVTSSVPSNSRPSALQVISTGGIYGAERVLLELARYLADQGWVSRVLAMDRGAEAVVAEARRMGLEADVLGSVHSGAFDQLRALKRFVRDTNPQVVHSHGYKPDLLMAANGMRGTRICFATCHTWYSDTQKMKLLEALDKRVLRRFNRVFVVSSELERDVIQSGVVGSKVELIPNGLAHVAPSPGCRARLRAELNVLESEAVVLRLGRLAESKGNRYLVEACAQLPAALQPVLVFAGDGEEAEYLRNRASELGIGSRVRFLGFRSDVADLLAFSDVVAMPSLKEGMPMVLIEAMAAMRPVVVTDVGEMGRVIQNGVTGWVVPPADVAALSKALAEILASKPLAAARASAAQALYESMYSRESMGSRYLRSYRAAVGMQ